MSGKKAGVNRMFKWIMIAAAAAALAAAAVFVRAKYVLPIAMYHVVAPGGAPNNRLVVSPQTFEKQMAFLKRRGYRVLWLEDAAEVMAGRVMISNIALIPNRVKYQNALPVARAMPTEHTAQATPGTNTNGIFEREAIQLPR